MKLKITVHGVAYEVDVEVLDAGDEPLPQTPLPSVGAPAKSHPTSGSAVAPPAYPRPQPAANADEGGVRTVTSPIAGTVQEVNCRPGDAVSANQVLIVMEAMKMNTRITAPSAGRVKAVAVAVGDTVREGQTLVEFD